MAKKKPTNPPTQESTAAVDEGAAGTRTGSRTVPGPDTAAVSSKGRKRGKAVVEQAPVAMRRPPTTGPFAVPADADLSYISPELQYLAKPLALFTLEPLNSKIHDEADLPLHQASLREFGIRRVLVARAADRVLEAGNGAAQAIQRNGWLYAPIALEDDSRERAQAFGLADNGVGALAAWSEANLAQIRQDIGELDLELDLDGMTERFLAELGGLEEPVATEQEPTAEQEPAGTEPGSSAAVPGAQYLHRLQVVCNGEAELLKLQGELEARGLTVKVMPTKMV